MERNYLFHRNLLIDLYCKDSYYFVDIRFYSFMCVGKFYFTARSISRFPGGPGRRSTMNPAV